MTYTAVVSECQIRILILNNINIPFITINYGLHYFIL